MKRICKECGQEKDLGKFVKGKGELYRYKCLECKNIKRRTGRPNTGRFKTGQKSIGVTFKTGHTPWYKDRGLPAPAKGKGTKESRDSAKYKEWENQVKERDEHKCRKCGSNEKLAAHHIKPWKDFPESRFDIGNGLTLCNSCHGKEEGFQKGHVTILSPEARARVNAASRGRKLSEAHIQKLKIAKLGKSPWNIGKSPSYETRRKMREAKLGKPSNRTKNKD